MKYAITVEEEVRFLEKEMRVGAVPNIGTAEAQRKGSMNHLALDRQELVSHWGEVVGEHKVRGQRTASEVGQ